VCPSVIAAHFPNIGQGNDRDTSPKDTRYNCIAHAASSQNRWWWPDSMGQAYWPPSAPREETIGAFIISYGTLGYVQCPDGSLEQGYEKIVVYAKGPGNTEPTHAARQLPSGKWTSKLGQVEDIEHDTPAVVEGPCYGQAVLYMKRGITP
jgi:hypothetical protein